MFVASGADGVTWGIDNDGQVRRYTGKDHWDIMPGSLSQISVANADNVWGVNAEGNVYSWHDEAYSWNQISGLSSQVVWVSVGNDGTVWAVDINQNEYEYQDNNFWRLSPPQNSPNLIQISVRNSNEVWGIVEHISGNSNIYLYQNNSWRALGSNAPGDVISLSVASDGAVFGVNSNAQIYRRITDNNWQLYEGDLAQIAVGDQDNVWAVDKQERIVRLVSNPNAWQRISASLTQVSAAADGTVWGINANKQIYHYQGNNSWQQLSGSLDQVAVGSEQEVWGLKDGTAYRRINGAWVNVDGSTGGSFGTLSIGQDMVVWTTRTISNENDLAFICKGNTLWQTPPMQPDDPTRGTPLKQISVGNAESIWCVNDNNQVFLWNGQAWQALEGNLSAVSVGSDGTVYGIDSNNKVKRYLGDNEWRELDKSLSQISVGNAANVWAVDANQEVYQLGGIRWLPVTLNTAPVLSKKRSRRSVREEESSAENHAQLNGANVQIAINSLNNMLDFTQDYRIRMDEYITEAYDLMNIPATHDPGQAFAEAILSLSFKAIAQAPIPGASTIASVVSAVYNYVNTNQSTDLHGTFASVQARFSQNMDDLQAELRHISVNLATMQADLDNGGVTAQDQSNWLEPFIDPDSNTTFVVADLATDPFPPQSGRDSTTALDADDYNQVYYQARVAGRLNLWKEALPGAYFTTRPKHWGGGPEEKHESDLQVFMNCWVDHYPNYYLKTYQRDSGKDEVWALKFYWLASGNPDLLNYAPDALCTALFQDDGAGNLIPGRQPGPPDPEHHPAGLDGAITTRKDVFKHWDLNEEKVDFLGSYLWDDWSYPWYHQSCYGNAKRTLSNAIEREVTINAVANINLPGIDLQQLNLPNGIFQDSNLSGANLEAADLKHADLANSNWSKVNLANASLDFAQAQGANLDKANLENVIAFGLQAQNSSLRGAKLKDAALRGADLRGADLRGADLRKTDLTGANLSGANLSGANLQRTSFRSADLSGANLDGLDLNKADLTFAIGVENAPITAISTSRTLLKFYDPALMDLVTLLTNTQAMTNVIGSSPISGFGYLLASLKEGAANYAQYIVPVTTPQAGNPSRDLTLTLGTAGQDFYNAVGNTIMTFFESDPALGRDYAAMLSQLGQTLGYTPIAFRTEITTDTTTDIHVYAQGPIGFSELSIISNEVRSVDPNFEADTVIQQAAAALDVNVVWMLGLDFSPGAIHTAEGIFQVRGDNSSAPTTLANSLGLNWPDLSQITAWISQPDMPPYLVSVSVQDGSTNYGLSIYLPYSIGIAQNVLTLVDQAAQQRFEALLDAAPLDYSYFTYLRIMCDFDGSTVLSAVNNVAYNPVSFTIQNGSLVPDQSFAPTVQVIATDITAGGGATDPLVPVTLEINVGGYAFNPFGDANDPAKGDVNKPRDWPPAKTIQGAFPAEAALSVIARSWRQDGSSVNIEAGPGSNPGNMMILLDGDDVPDTPGFKQQADLAEFLTPYTNSNGKIAIGPSEALFLFELGTTNITSTSADFQDAVVLISFDKPT